jgi:uncharacterized protein (TIGR03437 family)
VIKRSLGKAGIVLALTCLIQGVSAGPAQSQSLDSWRQQVLTLVNQERASAGLGALRMQSQLQASADRYCQYMATANFFAHEGPDGSTPKSRQEAAGYSGAVVWGENIAAGQPDPQSVMTAWMNSPGHRANILFPGFTEIGIGIYQAQGTRYGVSWAQEFGSRPGGGGASTGGGSTAPPPPITTPTLNAVSPSQGAPGDTISLSGARFGSTAGSVSFSGVMAQILAWSDQQIQVRVPSGASSGAVYVQSANGTSNGRNFTVLQVSAPPPSAPPPAAPPAPSVGTPTVTYVYPSTVQPGSRVTLYGRGFGQTRGTVRLNNVSLTIEYWYDTLISVTVPNGATSGPLTVQTAGGSATAGSLTVLTGTTPAPAPPPAPTPNPPAGGSGANNGGTTPLPTHPPATTTPARPIVRSVTYANTAQGRTMTLHGSGFGAAQGTVRFGRLLLPVLSWSDTQVVLLLPGSNYRRNAVGLTLPTGQRSTQVRTRF